MAFIIDATPASSTRTLRDLLIRITQAVLVQAKWSSQILDKILRGQAANRPDLPAGKLADFVNWPPIA